MALTLDPSPGRTLGSMKRSSFAIAATAAFLLASCGAGAARPADDPIACRLDALTAPDRAREQARIAEHRRVFLEVTELADGFAYRYPPDAALFVRLAELVTLEHRCCPFLDFALRWRGRDGSPVLAITSASARAFITGTFGTAPASERTK